MFYQTRRLKLSKSRTDGVNPLLEPYHSIKYGYLRPIVVFEYKLQIFHKFVAYLSILRRPELYVVQLLSLHHQLLFQQLVLLFETL